jgi:hypothetical protein
MVNWICFTNAHHNGHRTHDETVKAFRGTTLGEYIDFDKMAALCAPKPKEVPMPEKISIPSCKSREMPVVIEFNDSEVSELFNFLDKHKEEVPAIHEKVYQAMTRTLMARINH